jgi:hypothetical protein
VAGGSKNIVSKGAIINDIGVLKDESAFSEGQEIIYFVKNTRIYYASIVISGTKTEYYLGKILSVDELNRHVGSEMLLELPFSDIRLIEPSVLYNIVPNGTVEILSVSEDAKIYIDFSRKTLKDIKPESIMLVTVENGLVTGLEQVKLDLMQEEGIVSGIVEENNPALGYVTLYFPDGLGTSPAYSQSLSNYRTYSYLRAENVTVYKNGLPAAIYDINPGDSVFLKLDADGNLIRISASDNYYPVYGRVRAKLSGNLLIEKQDGTYEQITIPPKTPIFRQKRRISWDDIKEGDSVRILLQRSGSNVIIGEVTLEKKVQETTGIYRAQLGYYDDFSNSLVVTRLQQFSDGFWKQPETAGASKLQISENYKPYILKVYFVFLCKSFRNNTFACAKCGKQAFHRIHSLIITTQRFRFIQYYFEIACAAFNCQTILRFCGCFEYHLSHNNPPKKLFTFSLPMEYHCITKNSQNKKGLILTLFENWTDSIFVKLRDRHIRHLCLSQPAYPHIFLTVYIFRLRKGS